MRIITTSPHRGIAEGNKNKTADEASVFRVPIVPNFGAGMIGFLTHYASFMIGAVARAAVMRLGAWRPDIVWTTSPPLFSGVAGAIVARLFAAPHVLDIRDLWPDAAVAVGELNHGGRAFSIGKALEAWCYRHSAALTCTSTAQQTALLERSGKRATLVYNGVPAHMITDSLVRSPARRIAYAGNIGLAQGIEHLVRAVAQVYPVLVDHGWTVEIVGRGGRQHAVEDLITALNLDAIVQIHKPMPKQDVMEWLAGSAILFLNLVDGETFASAIPSKIFDYLAVKRPILAGVAGEAREILERTGANHCVAPGSVDGIAAGLVHMIESYSECNARVAANAELARSQFTREAAVDELEQALTNVITRIKG